MHHFVANLVPSQPLFLPRKCELGNEDVMMGSTALKIKATAPCRVAVIVHRCPEAVPKSLDTPGFICLIHRRQWEGSGMSKQPSSSAQLLISSRNWYSTQQRRGHGHAVVRGRVQWSIALHRCSPRSCHYSQKGAARMLADSRCVCSREDKTSGRFRFVRAVKQVVALELVRRHHRWELGYRREHQQPSGRPSGIQDRSC